MGEIENPTTTSIPHVLPSLTGCTIAVPAELPQAVVLANSFLNFHPQSEFALLLLDRPNNSQILPHGVKLLSLADLGLEPGEEWRLPMLFSQEELVSLLLPALLKASLQSGATVAAYFEPTTEVFGPLTDIFGTIESEATVVATEPVSSAIGGALGPSLVAVGRGSEETLRSWFDRLRNRPPSPEALRAIDSRVPRENALDSIPHRLISTKGFAVGYWTLNPETFAWNGERYEVDKEPLRSFDFRGYDPAKPHLLSKHQGLEPRILLSEFPALARLCDEYRDKVMRAGYGRGQLPSYPFDYLPSGLCIDPRMLRLYREAERMRKQGLEKEAPSPFGPQGEEGFMAWLNEPVGKTGPVVTRYMLAVYEERDDVRQTFPDPTGANASGFRDWYLVFGQRELNLPAAVIPFPASSKPGEHSDPLELVPAEAPINVAGYFRAELGIGTAARSLVAALEASDIPFNTISFGETANRQAYPFVDRPTAVGSADINIVCVNADQIAAFAEQTGPELREGRYTIGLWFWEVEDLPPLFHDAFNYVDEVWVASDFMRETFLKVSPKPVFKFTLPVLKPEIDPSLSRLELDLPNQFVFLFSFDFFSVLERKNPLGLIEAFTRAFKPGEGPVLVIKTINGDKRILEMEKLRYAARDRPDVILRDGYLSTVQHTTLTALADCYVSLHRSEGFGLTIAEAMALGKPAVATAYSGNLEFMTEANSYLCPCERQEVGPEREPYPATSYWSEPDVEAATGLLQHVYQHQDEARHRGLQAAKDIGALHSATVAGPVIRDRLAKIRHRRSSAHPIRSIAFLEDRLEELETRRH